MFRVTKLLASAKTLSLVGFIYRPTSVINVTIPPKSVGANYYFLGYFTPFTELEGYG
jgi:hypothetical protein